MGTATFFSSIIFRWNQLHTHTASIHTIKRNSSDSLEISISMDLNGHAWIQTFSQSVLNRHITAATKNNLVPNPKSEKHFPRKSLAPHGYCAKVKYKLWNAHKLKRFFLLDAFCSSKIINWIEFKTSCARRRDVRAPGAWFDSIKRNQMIQKIIEWIISPFASTLQLNGGNPFVHRRTS